MLLEKNVNEILENPTFTSGRKFKVLIGLNQKDGRLNEKEIQDGISKVQSIIEKKKKELEHKIDEIQVINYTWTPLSKFSGANYSEIRNKIYEAEENEIFFKKFKNERIENIFYLTIDPDSDVSSNVFERVENETIDKIAPLVIFGTYQFNIDEPNLIRDDNTLNWEGFLSSKEAIYDKNFKKEISKNVFSFVKFPYVYFKDINKKSLNEELDRNLVSLKNILERNVSGKIKLSDEGMSKIVYLINVYNKVIQEASISTAYEQEIIAFEKEIEEYLNIPRSVTGASILYPAEPVLFITLFQRVHGKEYDLKQLVDKARPEKPLWGVYSHTEEGETMVSTLRNIWRDYVKQHKEEKIEKREYVKVAFEYKTQIPDRSLKIDNDLLIQLPDEVKDLKEILTNEEKSKELGKTLLAIFAKKCQSSLTDKFLEQRRRYLMGESAKDYPGEFSTKPSRFGQQSGKAVYESLKDYFHAKKRRNCC